MFRKIAKLRRARRAFQEGRVEEALSLADDPEIREHLKAEQLRDDCLEALRDRADDRVRDGELSVALRDLEGLEGKGHRVDVQERAEEIRAMQDDRKEAQERARARYFRARLELDRGDLDRSAEMLTEILADTEFEDARRALDDVEDRRALAQREIERARDLVATHPGRAEEALNRAHEAYPRSTELKRAALDLARARIEILRKAGPSDGALASFLVEHGLMKRRLLNEMTAMEQRDLDGELNRYVGERVDDFVREGRFRAAVKLLERRRENLAPDTELDGIEESARGLVGADALLDRGDFDRAEEVLKAAGKRLGRLKVIVSAEKNLRSRREQVEPVLSAAEAALVEGRLEEGKEGLLEVLALAPEHAVARRRLRAVNEATRERWGRLLEARRLMDRGKYDDAMDILLAIDTEGPQGRDVALMRREVELLELSSTRHRSSESLGVAQRSPTPESPRMREGSTGDARWLLGVEEAGEFLVMEQGEIVIGSEASPEADLKLLAPLQSRHAVLRRATSFHGGCKYLIESCDDAEMRVNDIAVPRAELSDGDRIKLGRSFEMVFRRPCSRSGAARIDLGRSWSVGGCGSLLLLPPSGRAGALLIADRDDAHVRTDGKTGDVELYREASGQLRARGSRGVSLDRAEPCAEVEIGDAAGVSAEDLVLVIGPASI